MLSVIEKYKPCKGFSDLRKFNLSKRMFRKLWDIQDVLSGIQKNAGYFKKWHPGQLQTAKEVSAQYQQLLLTKGKKEGLQ